jgi:hypothetical protein
VNFTRFYGFTECCLGIAYLSWPIGIINDILEGMMYVTSSGIPVYGLYTLPYGWPTVRAWSKKSYCRIPWSHSGIIGGSTLTNRQMTTSHALQDCPLRRALTKDIWPNGVNLQDLLYGDRADLQRTAEYIRRAGLTVEKK